MYNHILVPVAFDSTHDEGRPALKVAVGLLAPGARLSLVHVSEPVSAHAQPYVNDDYQEKLAEAMKERLAGVAAEAQHQAVSDADVHILVGHASREILGFAEAHGVDMIVVHSHRPGFSDYFLGSTAARVVRHAQCSVLVIR